MIDAAVFEAARKLREKDMRARLMADSSVAMAMQELSEAAPDCDCNCREYAHRVAQLATTLLVSAIYSGDNELAEMKRERDRYQNMALDGLLTMPPKLFVRDSDTHRMAETEGLGAKPE